MNRKSPRIRFDDGPAGFDWGRRAVDGYLLLAGGGLVAGAGNGSSALRGLHAGAHFRGAFAALTGGAVIRRRRGVTLFDALGHENLPSFLLKRSLL